MSYEKIIFALDFPDGSFQAKYKSVIDKVGLVKIGMELFYAESWSAFMCPEKTFLDLKLNDIPVTVGRAIKALCKKYKPKYISIHLTQPEMIKAAVDAAGEFGTKIVGITVLTSMNESKCIDYFKDVPNNIVEFMAGSHGQAEYGSNFAGYVASGKEVELIRSYREDEVIIVPGVRSKGVDKGDQRRVVSPAEAIASGASYVVIGRQIRDAENPELSLDQIAKEIEDGIC